MNQDHHPLAQKWREQAASYEGDGQLGAALLRRVANELETYELERTNQPLTLDEAADVSGFHRDHIARLLAQEENGLENVGRKGAPLVRRGDLPMKGRRKSTATSAIVKTVEDAGGLSIPTHRRK
jgi:hypothetical protein